MPNGLFEGAEQTVTLTGDVTGSGTTSVATTIANDAVTYAKIQNVSATDKLLGRSSSGAGDVEEITCTAAGRALLDDANAAAQLTTLGVLNAIFTTVSRVAAWVWSATVSSVTYSLTIGTGNTTKIQTQTATYQNYAAANQTSAELRCSKLDSTAFGQVQAGASYSEVAFSNPSTSGVSRLRASLSNIFISILNASGFGNSQQTTQPGQWTNIQQSTDDNTLTIKEYADGQTKGAGVRYIRVYDTDGSTILASWTIDNTGHTFTGGVTVDTTSGNPLAILQNGGTPGTAEGRVYRAGGILYVDNRGDAYADGMYWLMNGGLAMRHQYGRLFLGGLEDLFASNYMSWGANTGWQLGINGNSAAGAGYHSSASGASSPQVDLAAKSAGVWGVTAGDMTAGAAFAFPALSPSQITSNQTNYSAFIGGSKFVRLSTDAADRKLQGAAAGEDGVEHVFTNVGSYDIIIEHNSASATGKVFLCSGNRDIILQPNGIVDGWYDATTQAWRMREPADRIALDLQFLTSEQVFSG